MRRLRSAVLYAALALTANAALAAGPAAPADPARLEALRQGDMEKLQIHATPQDVPDAVLTDAEGAPHPLSEYRGKYVVLNFWATWCAPCRREMGTLDRLQADLGGPGFAVLPVATLRNTAVGVQRFYAREGVTTLPVRLDPEAKFARAMGVFGLPVTLILDPEGREVARLIGGADWDSASAKAIFAALMKGS